jgi:RimJ/RimL family protein N-acetyltransferase
VTTAPDGHLDEVTVHGPRLSLRFATQDDAPALFELGRDPAVTRFFSWGPYTSVDQPVAYVRSLVEQRARGERLEFLIVDREDQAVGVTGLSEFSTRDRRAARVRLGGGAPVLARPPVGPRGLHGARPPGR